MHIHCRNITFTYPNAEKPVFSDLNLKIEEPGFHALFGPSGVGKTSFAGILSGRVRHFGGEVAIHGIDRIAYTYNLERLPGWSSVRVHLDKIIPEDQTGLKEELIPVFGIEKCLDQRFSQLSLGQKNRVNLLRYLLQGFQLLILDESLANVDERTRERIILKIKEIFPQVIFLYISHNVVEVAKLCRNIVVFRGAGKRPQTVSIKGLDLRKMASNGSLVRPDDANALEKTMLEIMNAA